MICCSLSISMTAKSQGAPDPVCARVATASRKIMDLMARAREGLGIGGACAFSAAI